MDVKFLNYCKLYNNFLRFKLYDRSSLSTNTFQSWFFKVHDREIKSQSRLLTSLNETTNNDVLDLKSTVGLFDSKCLSILLYHNVDTRLSSVEDPSQKVEKKLGINLRNKIDFNKVIFNFPDRSLSDNIRNALSLGLNFGLRSEK